MNFRLFKIFTILVSFLFLNGFTPFVSILGPGVTVLTSGNIYKATAQFIIDQSIKKKTGKNSLTLVKEELDKKKNKNEFNEELRNLVEKIGLNSEAGFQRTKTKKPIISQEKLYDIIPKDSSQPYDTYELINTIIDHESMDEYKKDYGQTLITLYAKIEGWSVGIIANQRKIVKSKKTAIWIFRLSLNNEVKPANKDPIEMGKKTKPDNINSATKKTAAAINHMLLISKVYF